MEANFTSVENGAIKRQLFKGCESALQLLAVPSRREWCEGFLPLPRTIPPNREEELCLLCMDPKGVSILSLVSDFVEWISGRCSLTRLFV